MSEFKPINTQEEFDAAVRTRLERERSKFADYEDLKNQVGTLTGERDTALQQLSDANARIKGYETDSAKTRIAHETGIPYEMAQRLRGETEEDIRKDAEAMAGFLKTARGPAPMYTGKEDPEPKNAALKNMLHDMRGD